MNSPEEIVHVALGKKPEDPDIVRPNAQFEQARVPRSAEDIGHFLERGLAEVVSFKEEQRALGKGVLSRKKEGGVADEDMSEEAVFVMELSAALKEWGEMNEIPLDRVPPLSLIARVLKGEFTTINLTPEETRSLMTFIHERFGVPDDDSIDLPHEEDPMKHYRGRQSALQKLEHSLVDSWSTILEAAWRHHYDESFPGLIREQVYELATTDTKDRMMELVQELSDRASRFEGSRFRKFLGALIEESIGSMSGKVITKAELAAFAEFVSLRLPTEERLPQEEIIMLMKDGALNEGARPPKEKLTVILKGFSENLAAVYDLAEPTKLFETGSASTSVPENWARFTDIQRSLFVDLVRGYYLREPYQSKARDELKDLITKKFLKNIKTGSGIAPADVKKLGVLLETRAEEICELMTKPEVAEEISKEETAHQEMGVPDIRRILSSPRVPKAIISGIRRSLLSEGMEKAREEIFAVIAATIMQGGYVKNLPSLLGRTPNGSDLLALEEVTSSHGGSSNKTGWDILLTAANGSSAFRTRMR